MRGGGAVLSLIVCLYLDYSKLLKLVATANAAVYGKNCDFRQISGFGIDDCWFVTYDKHLNDPV